MENSQKKYLVLFSGGYDSTTLLEWHLKQGHEVRAVHFIFKQSYRYKAEHNAVKNIIKALREKYYYFYYNEYDFNSSLNTKDSKIWAFLAAIYVQRERLDSTWEVQCGICKEDLDPNIQSIIDKGYPLYWIREIYNAGLTGIEDKPEITAPFINLSKKEYLEFISPEIKQLTLSCRRPGLDGEPCGRCTSCRNTVKRIKNAKKIRRLRTRCYETTKERKTIKRSSFSCFCYLRKIYRLGSR